MSTSPATVPGWALDALADVYDPCCREKGISVVEMGLIKAVRAEDDGRVRVELMLTSGWCPFASRLLTEIRDRIAEQPGVDADAVEVAAVWDEPWTPDRLSPRARSVLRFLPPPSAVPDRDAYVRDVVGRCPPTPVPIKPDPSGASHLRAKGESS
jgi:metal-sulfur cluster biosynthetic enzyme